MTTPIFPTVDPTTLALMPQTGAHYAPATSTNNRLTAVENDKFAKAGGTVTGPVTFSDTVTFGVAPAFTSPAADSDSTAVATTAWVRDRLDSYATTTQMTTAEGNIASAAAVAAAAIPATEKDAANGVAGLTSAGLLLLAVMPAGTTISVHWSNGPNAWPASRPTSRSDIHVAAYAPSGTAPPEWLTGYENDTYETF